ncbi:MAG: glycosyltransferase family 2 protein [Deltaproteobacteria bacterium]
MNDLKKSLLIIIPAFNEEGSIGVVIDNIKKHVPWADIAVVNDGSSDRTAAIASSKGVILISNPYNMGIGSTMQTGYKYAHMKGYDVAVQVDADGQHPAEQIAQLIRPVVENKADIVVGSRFLGEGSYRPSLARGAGMALFSSVVSVIIKEKVTDTTSGFRAAGKECIEFFAKRYPDDYPEVEALVLLHKKGFSIMEIPVSMNERSAGRSSITPIRSIYYMVKVLLAIFVDLMKKI